MKIVSFFLIIIMLSSCSNMNILQGQSETAERLENFQLLNKNYEHILSPDDKLSISVWNHDDLSIGSVFSIYNTNESFGKWILIENDSTAAIPYAGKQKIAGLTLNQAEKLVTTEMSNFIKDPIVEIRVLNREVTILGEVKSPGNYLLEKEENTLIEYIGRAEGLGFYANKRKIQVIRNDVSYRIDLTKLENLHQRNIYLQAKDIVYIPSTKGKKLDMKAPVLIPFASLLTSAGVLISVLSN